MVLHLKGADKDSCSWVPTQDCITLLDRLGVSIQAPIYLHCFVGGPAQIKLWVDTGRPVYFGVSESVHSMLDTQQEGVRAIPQDRILVKTNSPYLPCGVGWPMTPKHIGKVYQLVATVSGKSVEHLEEAVAKNFRTFFAKQLGHRYWLSVLLYAVYSPRIFLHSFKFVSSEGIPMEERAWTVRRDERALNHRAPIPDTHCLWLIDSDFLFGHDLWTVNICFYK